MSVKPAKNGKNSNLFFSKLHTYPIPTLYCAHACSEIILNRNKVSLVSLFEVINKEIRDPRDPVRQVDLSFAEKLLNVSFHPKALQEDPQEVRLTFSRITFSDD